ncbi:flagellar basal-body rod modification protein FlgD [Aquabacterium commune]|uniref:Basal-body rod modification protein FlgD n=1 Tax=Aquabacterium commune TaxID=70586 RepID=A0A4V3CVT0_9BURK|nr:MULTISPECIES: flagellar hook capping FlgD N-terminal domain-containing protein [Aquabacterium]MDI1350646.1 flagellar hook capping FlgD N-terminal domain-containing protein [Aquabacterium sp.]TDP83658.1 flagellar basal-body rod modification protein FlgD [Aquabacterium commune]
MTTAVNSTNAATSATSTTKTVSQQASEASDRFLKLLVTQMQNQDPLNPMDNAQVTSQMAQINTVTGIDKLNTTMGAMNAGMAQMQMLQGASLVGRQVLLDGNQLAFDSTGKVATGAYSLDGAASSVRIDIINAAGVTIDSVNQTGVPSGQQGFQWTPPDGTGTAGLTFKVTASSGNTTINASTLMTDTVDAINTSSGTLTLELRNSGSTAYSKVKAVA